MRKKRTSNKTQSLRRMLVPAFFLAALIPIMIFALLSQIRLRDSMKHDLDRQMESNLDKADQCLEMALDKYSTVLYDFAAKEVVLAAVGQINKDKDELDARSDEILHELSQTCNRNDGVVGITIVTVNQQTIFYDQLEASFVNSTWADKLGVPDVIEEEIYQSPRESISANGEETSIFQISRNLMDSRNAHEKLGTVTISVDVDVIRDAVANKASSKVYVCENGRIISSPDDKTIGRRIDDISAKEYSVSKRENARSGWEIYNYQSLAKYKYTLLEQSFFWFLIGIGTAVVLVALIYSFTRPIIQSVDTMVHVMNEIEKGNFEARIPFYHNMPSEIRRIGLGFNEMVEQIDILINQVKLAVTEQKNAELSALEAQIDPHFLYNTLDTINWKAIDNEEYEISEMIGALADILRYTVYNAGEKTTVEMEISWLREYILLQSAKLDRELETIVDIQEELLGCGIHKLLLQPFVENAIKHGWHQKEGPCILKIGMYKVDNQLHIVIKDNGKGISPEEVRILNDAQADRGNHLGIENVRKRLRLYYSGSAEVYLESEQGRFTRVHLFIPLGEEAQDENCNCGG